MTTQPVEANVVLTADNSQYDQAMTQSAGSTASLGAAVDSLGKKISSMSKTAGKGLIGIAAADVALITAATVAWAGYEKQVSRLNAQAAILARSEVQQERTLKDYTNAVKGLRTEYGTTTAEASKLVGVLAKMTTIRQSRDLADLSKVFTEMGKATGESSEGLANSMTNLQKIMGTPINSRTTEKYADMFTHLSAQTQTSAQGLIDFTAQLAPVGQMMGMNTKQLAGFATAFEKAGAVGAPAATVFNKVATDITRSLASGSTEVAHYANLIGVTASKFKEMDAGEQMVRILESIQQMGPKATVELERLGLEGPRSMKAISAILSQPGGIRAAVAEAGIGADSGASQKGADAAKTMSDSIDKLQESFKRLSETMGERFAPMIEKFIGGMTEAMNVINKIAEGPLGTFIGWVMKAIAPLAGGAGAMLLFAGALLKVAAAFTVMRSSAAYGLREGWKGNAGMTRLPDGTMVARGDGVLGPRGAELARGAAPDTPYGQRSTWLQRGQYGFGQVVGSTASSIRGAISEGYYQGREKWDPAYARPGTPGSERPGMFRQTYWDMRQKLQPSWSPDPLTGASGPRGPLSLAAGGAGRLLQQFVNPAFDQMAHIDATKRTKWLDKNLPFTDPMQRMQLGQQMGQVGLHTAALGAVGAAEAGIQANPLLTNAERDAQLARMATIKEETAERVKSAQATVTETQEKMTATEATRQSTGAVRDQTVGFNRFGMGMKGFFGGMFGGIKGGMQGAGQLMMRTGTAGPAAGMAAMAGASALGIESNAVMMGAMGAMLPGIGPIAAGVGATAGLGIDIYKANEKTQAGLDQMNEAIDQGGYQFTMMNETIEAERKRVIDRGLETGELTGGHPTSVSGWFGQKRSQAMTILTGQTDFQRNMEEIDTGRATAKRKYAVSQDIARIGGKDMELKGTAEQRAVQLEEWMTSTGEQMLVEAGVNYNDLVSMKAIPIVGEKLYKDALKKVSKPDPDLDARLRAAGGTGEMMMKSDTAKRAIAEQGNIPLLAEAVDELFVTARKSGLTNLDIIKEAEKAQENIGEENDRRYEIQMLLSQKAEAGLGAQMAIGGRVEQFQSTLGMQMAIQSRPGTQENVQQLEKARQATIGAMVQQVDIVKQQLLQQHQYEVQVQRAEEDHAEQRSYQLADYEKQRNRAEFSFNRSRNRATADYYRSVRRAHYDYNLQRERQEEDFNHQVEVNAKQQATGMMDIYKRVEVQRTASATWTLANARDQLTRMREMEENLDKLRKRGLSDSAIQQLKLTDPANAQQLARFVTEMTPAMIRQFNKVAGTERVKAAKDIVTDPSSLEWSEMRRGFRLSRERAHDDFTRGMSISRADFRRGLRQQRADYNIMMDQQADDFDEQMQRQEKAYNKSMKRAAEDIADSGREITGSLMQILKRGETELTGFAARQAHQVRMSLVKLRQDASPEAVKLMEELSLIFGFKYKAPAGSTAAHSGDYRGSAQEQHVEATLARHEGGTVPGWTPGRDVVKVNLSGGEAIMRPEWARAVGEKGVMAMNHAAKHGGFREGGVFWPVPGHTTSTYASSPPHDGADINRGSGWDDYGDPIRAFRSGTIVYVGSGRGYGDAIFQRTRAGTVVYGHTSAQFVHAGQHVAGGELIGNVGSTGNSSAPHLHFGIPGGTYAQALALLQGAMVGKFHGMKATTTDADIESIFKDRYPQAERSVRQGTSAIHPLKPGDISAIINRYGHRALRGMRDKYGAPGATGSTGEGTDIGREPSGHMSNERIVHIGARRYGWGPQWPSLRQLLMAESGFDNKAQNPSSTAYGMFQFLDGTWAGTGIAKTSDPWKQTQAGLRYIKNRYGSPNKAWDFWQANHSYGDGSLFTGPSNIQVGERGPEAVIPLNARGGDFMAEVLGNVMGGRHMASMRGGTNIYARVDHSTNFTGAITVQANNPSELIHKLQARQRVMALSRPSLTGSAA